MSTSPVSEPRRRMRSVLRRIRENEGIPTARRSESPADIPAPAPAGRRRAMPSERYQRLGEQRLRRVRRFFEQDNSSRDSLQDLQEASERLAQSNEDLRNMLDRPVRDARHVPQPDRTTDEGDRRRKRRRTDSWMPTPPLPKVEYGYNGQVGSGPLDMELVHADGGNMGPSSDLQANWSGLGLNSAENILRDDSSVYRSGSRRSNIVLQHPAERLFNLDKLVIIAPTGTADDALLEGLVFVSLKKDATFDRTAQYQIHHYPTSQFGPRARQPSGRYQIPPNVATLLHSMRADPDAYQAVLNSGNPLQAEGGRAADCDAASDSSEADEQAGRPSPGRPRHVIMPLSFPEDESDSNSDIGSVESDTSVPLDTSLRPGPPQDPSDDLPNRGWFRRGTTDEDDDYDNVLAQFDFDEVLRRGNEVAQDRRRRRRDAIRERVQQQREQRDRHARLMQILQTEGEAPNPLAPVDEDEGALSGTGSDIPGEEEHVLQESRDLVNSISRPPAAPVPPTDASEASAQGPPRANAASLAALDGEDGGSERRRRSQTPSPSDFDLLPISASFTVSPHTCRRHSFRTLQHPAPPSPTQGTSTPSAGVRIISTRRGYGRRITLRFDPPIAARYVLLKLWKAGRRDRSDGYGGGVGGGGEGGVDVERVRVEGWCGVRFFPALEAA